MHQRRVSDIMVRHAAQGIKDTMDKKHIHAFSTTSPCILSIGELLPMGTFVTAAIKRTRGKKKTGFWLSQEKNDFQIMT